jgi:hypothetical protein
MILVNPMMRTNSKKILSLVLAVGFNLSVMNSVFAVGAIDSLLNAKNRAEGFKKQAEVKGICLGIDEISSGLDEGITNKNQQIESWIQNRLETMEKNRTGRDEKLTEFRINADEWRDKSWKKLEAKAETDEQKEAVRKFKEAMEEAVKARRDAIDSSIDAFRDGVDKAKNDHQEDIQKVANLYGNTVKAAFEKARLDCENGVDEKEVRTNLRTSLQAARGQLREDRAGVTKFRDAIHALVSAKKTAFEKAISDFKTAVQEAKKELQKSWPQ